MTTTVLETCVIPPPPGDAAELSLPLCFFDISWIHFHPIRQLIFYDQPCSESEFSDKIVPNLKQSLSLTLKHYLPVAGNLLFPLDTDKNRPLIRYVSGDTVPLKIAVSGRDFDEAVASHARVSDEFYDFLPPMPPFEEEENYIIAPLMALQVTHFPGRGICIGLSNHHCLGDGRSIARFMWSWAEINRSGGDEQFLLTNGASLPVFDRSSVFGDMSGANERYWSVIGKKPLTPSAFPLPTNRVRASFTLHQSDIKRLKDIVMSKHPELGFISSFAVTAAYTWTSVVKSSAAAAGEELDETRPEVLLFAVDARGRPNALMDSTVPANYFGNCLGGGIVKLEHRVAAAEGGFVAAAAEIAAQIKNNVNNKDNFLKGIENWATADRPSWLKNNTFGVSGSPKFDLLDSDFGWGKARRLEVLSTDKEKYSMSLCNSRDSDGGLVVGLSLPPERMEAVAAIFADGLKF